MQVVLPLAGYGKRMRPQTWSKPKPLVSVAGKPVLGHVLDTLEAASPDSYIFITGWLGEQVREYMETEYPQLTARYVVQEELKGQAHAIHLAEEWLKGPTLIVFVDTFFVGDICNLGSEGEDGIIWTKEVPDPRRFGIVVVEDGFIMRFVEKPSTMEHRQAIIGAYWVRDGEALIRATETLMASGRSLGGEYYLADALQIMVDEGARFVTRPVSVWEDCGTPEALLHTQRYLLDHGHHREVPVEDAILVPPVHVADGAVIRRSVVGPYVSVGNGARVEDSVVRDAVIETGAIVSRQVLANSLVGRHAILRGDIRFVNVGDDAVLESGSS
ncbi:MAG: sugar phosphate nucleotidyltransferase [Anaerolineae bacterium]